jgi:DegV family protein with EDD domain
MIVIATDSTAYLTRQEAKELGVVYIPMTYSVDGESYMEGFIRNKEDNETLCWDSSAFSTSQPMLGSFYKRFKKCRDANFEILCLTISARLSGTHNNALVCARELGDDGIRVVDTKTSAGGMFMLIKQARALINEGYSLDETADRLLILREKVQTRFSVADLAPLRRSGRLGLIRQSIGTILNQRPILTCQDGAVVYRDIARGKNEQMRKLVDAVPENGLEVMVQYFREQDMALEIARRLEQKCGRPISVRRIGTVLAVHMGFDVVGTLWREP